MIVCIENPKESSKQILEVINKFSNVAGCKISTQKSVAFLYTCNEQSQKEINNFIYNGIKKKNS